MQDSLHLLRTRRFWPIFTTQFLGAFNDNLFRTSMVLLVIYGIYRDAEQEAAFSAVAGGLFILPFFLLSALAGQLADALDKAKIIRIVKSAEIAIMVFGAAGLLRGRQGGAEPALVEAGGSALVQRDGVPAEDQRDDRGRTRKPAGLGGADRFVADECDPGIAQAFEEGLVVEGDHECGGVAPVQREPFGVDGLQERGERVRDALGVGALVVGVDRDLAVGVSE